VDKNKYKENLGLEVAFKTANPLSQSNPAVPDLEPRTVRLPKGYKHVEGALPLSSDIIWDMDVPVVLGNGNTIYADIFRPESDEPVPVLLAYSPYGKRGGYFNDVFNVTNFGVPVSDVSMLQSFETQDPAYWCAHGYALVFADAAGTGHSGGDNLFMGAESGRNAADVVEYLGVQSWSNGKVGMIGNSALAMIQWATAALQPPHLAAIAPWEGGSDTYREVSTRGGIPDFKFRVEDISAWLVGEHDAEDTYEMSTRSPLRDAYWADKRAPLEEIQIPAYIVASWTSPIHARGTFQGFRDISSPNKWLRVHNTQEWVDGVEQNNVKDLNRFFDRYLKGVDNGWEATPQVRLAILDPGGVDTVGRAESSWPLERQQWKTLFLDPSGVLSETPLTQESVVEYEGDDLDASIRFTTTFEQDTEITGYLNLHLWVEAVEGDDMDMFAAVYKEDVNGKRLHHIVLSAPASQDYVRSLADERGNLPGTLSYTGPVGRLRVSHRGLDFELSTPAEPVLAHTAENLITPGECVPVELTLWPTSMVVHPGERLVVELAGHPVGPPKVTGLPGSWRELPTRNKGTHRIRTGGRFDSHLLLPVVP